MQKDQCEHCGRPVTGRLSDGRIQHLGDHHRRGIFSDDYGTWRSADESIDRSAPVHHQVKFHGGPLSGLVHHSLNVFPYEVRHETADGVAVYRSVCVPLAEFRFVGYE